jgi:hypothetical protein
MSIILRPVATFDLNVRFARDMGNKKVRHYLVRSQSLIMAHFTGKTAEDMVRDYIYEKEGTRGVEFHTLGTTSDSAVSAMLDFDLAEGMSTGNALRIKDISNIVLKGHKSLSKALSKTNSHNLIHQYRHYNSVLDMVFDRFAWLYNKYIANNVNWLTGNRSKERPIYRNTLNYLSYRSQLRISPVRFLSVAFKAEQVEYAVQALIEDLEILNKNRLLLGHLTMPSIMQLADSVGVGSLPYVVFCFPIVDEYKLNAMLEASGVNPNEVRLKLLEIGLKYESLEGGVGTLDNKPLNSDYEIEEIDIAEFNADQARQATIDAFEASKDLVNVVAGMSRKNLANLEKVESRSVATLNKLEVDVTLRDKETGKEIIVDSKLRNRLSDK